jgi:Tfp pilus assembly protein PilN
MINLLPPEEKNKIQQEKQLREFLILAFTFFSALLCLGLILFLIKIDLESKLALQQTILEQRKDEFDSSEAVEVENEVVFLNQLLDQANSFYQDKTYLTDVLEQLSQALPQGISLNTLSYKQANNQISLSGIAVDREALLELKNNLESNPNFKKIYFPSSNWVSPQDINFLVSFVIQ